MPILLNILQLANLNGLSYFIGPVKVDLETLKKNSNLHFFPPVTYNELPKYLAGIDVYIIPYKVNELSRYINPLKLKECLAVGKPVVSTPLPEVLKITGRGSNRLTPKKSFSNRFQKPCQNQSIGLR